MAKDKAAPAPRETPAKQPTHQRGRIASHPKSEDDRLRTLPAGGPPPEKQRPTPASPKRGRATTTPKSKPTKGAK